MSNHDDGHAVPKNSNSPILKLDVEQYIHQFKDFDLTEDQKIEVLQCLWDMMSQFVDLGFELEPCENNPQKP
ncbi:MAG: hypothetical protein L3J04_06225 [Robiginitomaculum sp.]|nr:hypothetical protein [Robiginitomaculum sp.]